MTFLVSSAMGGLQDNARMTKSKVKSTAKTGLYHARNSRGLSQEKLATLADTTKQTVIRLEKGAPLGMKFTLEWARRFAPHVGYTAEQLMFWKSEYGDPDTPSTHIESSHVLDHEFANGPRPGQIPEYAPRAGMGGGGVPERSVVRDGNVVDPIKPEGWLFPHTFLSQELRVPTNALLVVEAHGDSMSPTILPGERVLVNTGHKIPTPDGIYAIRDRFGELVVKRLHVVAALPKEDLQIRIISDNTSHGVDQVRGDEIEIVGKVVIGLRRF